MTVLFRIVILLAVFAGISVACQRAAPPEPFAIVTATPGGRLAPTPISATVGELEDYVISAMPHCLGLTDLRAPVQFDWPNLDEALEKLEEYNWGYYTCDLTQPATQSFMRDSMPKPPYLWREVNHAIHNGGQVTLYYQPYAVVFMYVWLLPRSDGRTSYMIIARGDPGVPQTWECRLPLSPVNSPLARLHR